MKIETDRVALFPGFEVTSNDIVLDVGCGCGGFCRAAGMVGADVIGIDIEPTHVATTVEAMRGVPARSFRGIVSDSDPIPLPDATATVVICTEVMEHVDNPVRFLAELVRVGKPGARYCLSVPSSVSESLMKIVSPPSYFEKPGHVRVFEKERLDRLIRDAGLEIDLWSSVGFYWTIWWVLRMASGSECYPESLSPAPPLLADWEKVWRGLHATALGSEVGRALDAIIPKSILAFAHKPAAVARPHSRYWKRFLQRVGSSSGAGTPLQAG